MKIQHDNQNTLVSSRFSSYQNSHGGDISRHNKIFKMKSLILKKMSMLILVIKY
jgi:hypothetical protein